MEDVAHQGKVRSTKEERIRKMTHEDSNTTYWKIGLPREMEQKITKDLEKEANQNHKVTYNLWTVMKGDHKMETGDQEHDHVMTQIGHGTTAVITDLRL